MRLFQQGPDLLELLAADVAWVFFLAHSVIISNFSKIVNKVKGATGTVYQKTPEYADFSGWAAGFDSFSVSFSDLHRLRRHIEEQHTIHQEISFEEEYGQLLEENGFDPHQTSVPASSTVHFSANTHPKNGIK